MEGGGKGRGVKKGRGGTAKEDEKHEDEEKEERLFSKFLADRQQWAELLLPAFETQLHAVRRQQLESPGSVTLPSEVGMRPVSARARGPDHLTNTAPSARARR